MRTFPRCLAVNALLLSFAAHAAPETLPTFTTTESFKKPTFKDGDEQFVRDFAKSMGGATFTANMELPTCMSRTHAASSGGFIDAFRNSDGTGVLLRVPVDSADIQYRNVSLYRSDYPRMAYLEFRNKMEGFAADKPGGWTATLVLPPLKDAASPVGPRFETVSSTIGTQRLRDIRIAQMPGTQTRLYLGAVEKLLSEQGQAVEFKLTAQMIERAGDSALPRVVVATRFPRLLADLRAATEELNDIVRRDRANKCAVLGSACRDGECR